MKVGWFSTGCDEEARTLLAETYHQINGGYLDKVSIEFVFSNRERGERAESDLFFDLVDEYGLNLICYSHRKFKPKLRRRGILGDPAALKRWRIEYDRMVMEKIRRFSPSIILLVGYMLILGEEMCRRYVILNLHPAPPGGPIGGWKNVIWEIIKDGWREAGGMIHIVTEELDKGPPVTYFTFPIKGKDFEYLWREFKAENLDEATNNQLFKRIRLDEAKREGPLLIETLKLMSEGEIDVVGRDVYYRGVKVEGGISLNRLVDGWLGK